MCDFARGGWWKLAAVVLVLALVLGNGASAQAQSVLRRGNGEAPQTLDPARATKRAEYHILYDLLEGLISLDARGALVPGAAASWQWSEDGLTWAFTLRPGLQWSNGAPLTAGDFVFSFRRVLDRQWPSPNAVMLLSLRHADEVLAGTRAPEELGISAADPQTLILHLERPDPTLLHRLAHPVALPVPEAVFRAEGEGWQQPGKWVGNGAYRLVEGSVGGTVTLARNPHYHSAEAVKIEQIRYIPTPERNREYRAYRNGELDITFEIPGDKIKTIIANSGDAFWNKPILATYYYAFNFRRPPFSEAPLALRQALSLALDRDALAQGVLAGIGDPAWSLIPPAMPGYTPVNLPHDTPIEARREEARKIFTAMGYRNSRPLTVELLYPRSLSQQQLAEAVAEQWRETFGRQAIVISTIGQDWRTFQDTRNRGDFQMIRGVWVADRDDPADFFDLFRPQPLSPNVGGYTSAEFEALVGKATYTLSSKKRPAVLREAEQQFLNDLPILPVFHYRTRYLVNPRVKGWEASPNDFHLSRWLSLAETPSP